jgi:hypothetical protein
MVLVRSAARPAASAAPSQEIRPVMLADAEHLEADLIGQLDLFHQVAQPLRGLRICLVAGSGVFSTKCRRRFPWRTFEERSGGGLLTCTRTFRDANCQSPRRYMRRS